MVLINNSYKKLTALNSYTSVIVVTTCVLENEILPELCEINSLH